jgi:hypothetical protein
VPFLRPSFTPVPRPTTRSGLRRQKSVVKRGRRPSNDPSRFSTTPNSLVYRASIPSAAAARPRANSCRSIDRSIDQPRQIFLPSFCDHFLYFHFFFNSIQFNSFPFLHFVSFLFATAQNTAIGWRANSVDVRSCSSSRVRAHAPTKLFDSVRSFTCISPGETGIVTQVGPRRRLRRPYINDRSGYCGIFR